MGARSGAARKMMARTGAKRSSRMAGTRCSGSIWGCPLLHHLAAIFLVAEPGGRAGLVLLDSDFDSAEQRRALAARAREAGLVSHAGGDVPALRVEAAAAELAECYRHLPPIEPLRADYGLLQAVLDPYVNAMHVALLRQRKRGEEARRVVHATARSGCCATGPRGSRRRRRWRC